MVSATHLRIHYQQTYTSKIYAMAFSVGLNGLQVDGVNTENYSQSSRQTQFIASKLVAACSTLVLTNEYTTTLQTSASYMYIYAIAFSAGLNGLQVDQLDRKKR